MIEAIRANHQWQFLGALVKADRGLAVLWWSVLILRGLLPAAFAVAMGWLIGAVQNDASLTGPLTLVGVVFVLLQVLGPLHQAISANLGSRTAAWLYDQLTEACVEQPGMGHLEDPDLTNDLAMARDFDLGISGPPLNIALDFVASGFVEMVGGLVACLVLAAYAWWAPLVLGGAWLMTHWLLRESGVWKDRQTDEVREAQRHADYAYRLAVDSPAAKEVRLFGLGGWVIDRFRKRREQLHALQWQATRLRQRPVIWSLLLVLAANVLVFWSMGSAAMAGTLELDRLVTFASAAIASSMIAFGGLSWALDGAAAPVGAMTRLRAKMPERGSLVRGEREASELPAASVRFLDLTFSYPSSTQPVLQGFDLDLEAGTSLAIVGQNGAGKTTIAKLLCRLYDPTGGTIAVDGHDLRTLDVISWRRQVAAVFQDYVRFELTLRENVAPHGAPDDVILAALDQAGAAGLANLDTILARGYPGGTDLSGGQWQRVALARTICAVMQGARLVLLDEPTAQLDVRGEAEIFRRLLEATRDVTTILVSHRFSTVRHVDRICVLEEGRVIELGSHDELMALGGRYQTMFDLQASRFDDAGQESGEGEEQELVSLD